LSQTVFRLQGGFYQGIEMVSKVTHTARPDSHRAVRRHWATPVLKVVSVRETLASQVTNDDFATGFS